MGLGSTTVRGSENLRTSIGREADTDGRLDNNRISGFLAQS